MTRKDARRVARYHARTPGCASFTEASVGYWRNTVWRNHFEADLAALQVPKADRAPVEGEEALIEAFLTDGLTVRYVAERGSER